MRLPEIMEHLKYLEKRIFKGHALWIPVKNMDEGLHKRVLDLLALFEQKGMQVFFLSAGDPIAFFSNNKLPDMMLAALKIKALNKIFFAENKIEFFNLSADFATLRERIERAEMMPPVRKLKTFQNLPLSPIQEGDKQRLLNILTTSDISHLVRHNRIYRQDDKHLCLYQEEVYCPFADVHRTLLTTFDLAGDFIFQNQLKWQIEKKVLQKYPTTMAFHTSLWRLVQAQEYDDMPPVNTTFILGADSFMAQAFLFPFVRQNTTFADTRFILRLNKAEPLHLHALPFDKLIMPWPLAEQHQDLADKIIVEADNISQYHAALDKGFRLFSGKCLSAQRVI